MCKKKVTSVELSLHTGAIHTFIGQNYFLDFSLITLRKVHVLTIKCSRKTFSDHFSDKNGCFLVQGADGHFKLPFLTGRALSKY